MKNKVAKIFKIIAIPSLLIGIIVWVYPVYLRMENSSDVKTAVYSCENKGREEPIVYVTQDICNLQNISTDWAIVLLIIGFGSIIVAVSLDPRLLKGK